MQLCPARREPAGLAMQIAIIGAEPCCIEGQPQPSLAAGQRLLAALAVGDIERGADDAHGMRFRVEQHLARAEQPAHGPVRHDDAMLDLEVAAAGRVQRGFVCAQDTIAVIGMCGALEGVEIDFGTGRQAVERLEPIGPEQGAGHDVVVPQAKVGGVDRELQLLLARLQRLFGVAPRRDVHHDGHDAFGHAVGVLDDLSPRQDPADAAARQQHPELARHWRAHGGRVSDIALHRDGVVGVDAQQKRARILAGLAGREAEHRIDAGRAEAGIGADVALPDAHAGHFERLAQRAVTDLREDIRLRQVRPLSRRAASARDHATANLSHPARRSRATKSRRAPARRGTRPAGLICAPV